MYYYYYYRLYEIITRNETLDELFNILKQNHFNVII